ncbi:MAG: hypothetical protein ABI844_16935 [Saprospiraceae bacterium]
MFSPIKTDKEYESYLEKVYELMQCHLTPNSIKFNELEILSVLVKDYEDEKFNLPPPSSLETIKFKMD